MPQFLWGKEAEDYIRKAVEKYSSPTLRIKWMLPYVDERERKGAWVEASIFISEEEVKYG